MNSCDKFKEAQGRDFERALAEMRSGRKTTHWIWYVFPQLTELGRSPTAKFYGINGLTEATDYLRDALLCGRMLLITRAVADQLANGVPLEVLMGGAVDSAKLSSSLTLFQIAARNLSETDLGNSAYHEFVELSETILTTATGQGFPRCAVTLAASG